MRLARFVIFLGSFLSFFVQPLVGRTLLPSFGGSATVWVTCLVAFQFLLLVGYGYAFVPARGGVRRHLALVFCAAALAVGVPLFKESLLVRLAALPPVVGVVLAVVAVTGLVSVVLSANSTVVQSWVGGGREVYRLYSVGNVGSFAGLLAYPLLVEPWVSVTVQWVGLGVAIGVYGAGLAALARRRGDCPNAVRTSGLGREEGRAAGVPSAPVLWVVLPAVSCALMTAVTTYLTTDFVPLPLLWAVLLAVFLLSYVIGFSRAGERYVKWWAGAGVFVVAFAVWAYWPREEGVRRLCWNGGAALALLGVVCTALHAWLCRIRPETRRLPHFYFCIALGGCVGGVLTGIVAPLVFTWVWEYALTLGATVALLGYFLWVAREPETAVLNWIGLVLLAGVALALYLCPADREGQTGKIIHRARGFYGVVTVGTLPVEYGEGETCDMHVFVDGKTAHGTQMMGEGVRLKPRAYYSLNGGAIPFAERARGFFGETNRPLRVALVGMGIASLAACGEKGDEMRFYEISPEVIDIATNAQYFTYLAESRAACEIVAGDARLELEKDRAAGKAFDLIVIDAYSGDSIPTHLTTREAMRLYRSMLAKGGMLAFHLSNWHMNLWPTVKAAAKELELEVLGTVSGEVTGEYVQGSSWAFMTEGAFKPRLPTCCRLVDWSKVEDRPLVTDACGSLLFSIRFNYAPPLLPEW